MKEVILQHLNNLILEAEQVALKDYPICMVHNHEDSGEHDMNLDERQAFLDGVEFLKQKILKII